MLNAIFNSENSFLFIGFEATSDKSIKQCSLNNKQLKLYYELSFFMP